MVMLFVQLGLLAILVAIVVILIQANLGLNDDYMRLKRENKVLAQYANFSSFFHCKYYPATDYEVKQCGWARDEASFMIRYHRRRTGTFRCASRFEMIPCDLRYPSEYRDWHNSLKYKILINTNNTSDYRPCAGLSRTPIGPYGISPQTPVLAPQIKNLRDVGKGIILRPKDFIMRCPICMVGSRFSSNNLKNRCARALKTLHEGWPQKAARCDEAEVHPVKEFCNTFDAVYNKVRGIEKAAYSDEGDYDQSDD